MLHTCHSLGEDAKVANTSTVAIATSKPPEIPRKELNRNFYDVTHETSTSDDIVQKEPIATDRNAIVSIPRNPPGIESTTGIPTTQQTTAATNVSVNRNLSAISDGFSGPFDGNYVYDTPDPYDDVEEDVPPLPPPLPPCRGGPPTFSYQQSAPVQYHSRNSGQSPMYGQPSTYSPPSYFPLHPDVVVEKYAALKSPALMSRMAVKLARESFFGEELMQCCTPQGNSSAGLQELPKSVLYDLKLYLARLFPSLSKADFEGYWKNCITSIGQACKGIRTKQKCKEYM